MQKGIGIAQSIYENYSVLFKNEEMTDLSYIYHNFIIRFPTILNKAQFRVIQ